MKKLLSLCLILLLIFTLTMGCTPKDTTEDETPDTDQTEMEDDGIIDDETEDEADVVTGPSYVTDEASINNVMGSEGTWIVIFTKDMTTDQDLVLEGEFKNNDEVVRKIAAYAQDENRVKTERYTITAPKLTIKSENSKLVGGTFVGDVYVEANGFSIDDGEVQGNIYFSKDEYKNSFQTTNEGKVTGTTEVQ